MDKDILIGKVYTLSPDLHYTREKAWDCSNSIELAGKTVITSKFHVSLTQAIEVIDTSGKYSVYVHINDLIEKDSIIKKEVVFDENNLVL